MSALRNSNGILNFAPKRDGVLALGNPSADNAMLGYLAGALQGGNLGQSIGRGLAGFVAGTRLDEQRLAPAQTYAALAAAGIPDALARAAALNRDVMKAVAPAYLGELPVQGAIGEGAAEEGARETTKRAASDTAAVAALHNVIGRLGELVDADTVAAATPSPAQPAAERARNAVTADLARALRASGAGDDDARALQEMLASVRTPDELKGAVGRGLDLVNGRLGDLETRYRRAGNPALLPPKSKATLDKLRQWSAGIASPQETGRR